VPEIVNVYDDILELSAIEAGNVQVTPEEMSFAPL